MSMHIYHIPHSSPRVVLVCGTGDPYNLLLASIWEQENHRNTSDGIRDESCKIMNHKYTLVNLHVEQQD